MNELTKGALNNRAVAYWEIGRDEEAMADFLAAAAAAPVDDPIPRDNLERFQNRRRESPPELELQRPTACHDDPDCAAAVPGGSIRSIGRRKALRPGRVM
ncbi:hypothetical protein [Aquisphaera insulae]|uniref:hypothetical protein n=1 Tax=Aquisphaera insulae TaxID=2712864 RepID=UPI0013EAD18D|nr:hypothetical protein [Aquisphaera insulae]